MNYSKLTQDPTYKNLVANWEYCRREKDRAVAAEYNALKLMMDMEK